MKILFYKYGNICEPEIIQSLETLGFTVVVTNEEISNKRITDTERIDTITSLLKRESCLFVFSVNYFPVISEVCNIFNIPYVGWCVDAPIPELFHKSIFNKTNRIFCFDSKQYNEVKKYNPQCIFYLPLCTNVKRWDKEIRNISDIDIANFSHNISFVGSLYIEHDRLSNTDFLTEYDKGYIQGLYECQKQVLGSSLCDHAFSRTLTDTLKEVFPNLYVLSNEAVTNIDTYITSQKIVGTHNTSLERQEYLALLSQHHEVALYTRSDISTLSSYSGIKIINGCLTQTEMPRIFNLSKINLNFTSHSIRAGIPLRCFDIMGCRGFLLTNYQEGMDEFFEAGIDYDYFTCREDLIDKCSFYLSHDGLRNKIAQSGYDKVSRYHTYANRISVILKASLNL